MADTMSTMLAFVLALTLLAFAGMTVALWLFVDGLRARSQAQRYKRSAPPR